ncbi:MAG TPA: carboxypeptidase-like regulatory domain-containing protein, partial [Saprospiraceae bacterium]|nr:carboxypeptidase-like regulatory domain-containing protein [Saprospiraceae bacterium]
MKSQSQLSFPGKLITLLVFLISSYSLQAQGIKGKVVDVSGEPLPFASIGVMGTSQGVASNVEGEYILALAPGKHKVRFQ